jgi:hypothetical protein
MLSQENNAGLKWRFLMLLLQIVNFFWSDSRFATTVELGTPIKS